MAVTFQRVQKANGQIVDDSFFIFQEELEVPHPSSITVTTFAEVPRTGAVTKVEVDRVLSRVGEYKGFSNGGALPSAQSFRLVTQG